MRVWAASRPAARREADLAAHEPVEQLLVRMSMRKRKREEDEERRVASQMLHEEEKRVVPPVDEMFRCSSAHIIAHCT